MPKRPKFFKNDNGIPFKIKKIVIGEKTPKVKRKKGAAPKKQKIPDTSNSFQEQSDDELEIGGDTPKDDSFSTHFECELKEDILSAVSSKPPVRESMNETWKVLKNMRFIRPKPLDCNVRATLLESNAEIPPAKIRDLKPKNQAFSLENCSFKNQILTKIQAANTRFNGTELTDFQKELLKIFCNYQDLYYPERNLMNSEELRFAYSCHAVNHALKSRMKVIHNDKKADKSNIRDCGIVRPKVLIVVPFKDSALRVVKMMSEVLLGENGMILNKNRFFEDYSGQSIYMPVTNPKPPDYEHTFSGNTGDNFKIGISVTKKCLKLFADFYSSDIIIASPLALRMLIGSKGDPERDYDFLSSIEILIMDQADLFLMQNWDHILHIMDHIHLVPKESHDTDLTRVRMWSLNGWSKFYMQFLLFSSHPLPEVTALFSSRANNYAGQVIVANPIAKGSIHQVAVQFPQMFHHIECNSVLEAIDKRFEVFQSKFLPQFKDPLMKHTLIYVPSYFDYVKIRNYFKKQDLSFVQICEYSKNSKISRARDLFFHGDVHFLLYSERFHFFRRIRLKGIRHILFYQPPTFPHFYSEMCNFLQSVKGRNDDEDKSEMSISTLYTKYDVTQLAAILGTERATRMLSSEQSVHMLMTDS